MNIIFESFLGSDLLTARSDNRDQLVELRNVLEAQAGPLDTFDLSTDYRRVNGEWIATGTFTLRLRSHGPDGLKRLPFVRWFRDPNRAANYE